MVLGAMALATLLLACDTPARPDTRAPQLIVADVIVSVTNRSSREMQIYVGSATQEHSLGPVPGRSFRSFSLPSGLGDSTKPLYFEARARRHLNGIRSDPFSVSAGEQVLWVVGERGGGTVTKR